MEKGAETLFVRADTISSNMFDNLVQRNLDNEVLDVEIEWIPNGEFDEDGEPEADPRVTIDGVPARLYAKRILEWTTTDESLIAEASKSFETKVACMWDSTIEYYNDLEDLNEDIETLVVQKYFDIAVQQFDAQGLHNIGDGEVITTARRLAIQDLGAWVAALDAQAEVVKG